MHGTMLMETANDTLSIECFRKCNYLLGVGSIAGFFAKMFLEGMGYSSSGAEEFFLGYYRLSVFYLAL